MVRRAVLIGASVVLLASTLVGVSAVVSPDAPAGAVGAVNLFFTKPGTTPVYGGNEVVALEFGNINFVGNCSAGEGGRLTGGIKDTYQPWADLYLVPAGRTYTNNAPLVDIAGAPNSLHGGIAGSFLYEPLGATIPTGKITAGHYGVVVDECQNGVFDTGEDTYVDEAFRVDVTGYVPHFNPELSAFVDAKLAAEAQNNHLSQVDQLLALKQYYDTANQAVGAVTAISAEGMMVFGINQAIGAIVAASPYAVLKDRAQELARETVAQYRTKMQRLAADPPSSDYARFDLPVATGAWMNESARPLSTSFQGYISQIDSIQALSGAILDAVERYQGAEAAGDQAWALRHARSIVSLTTLYEARVASLSSSIDGVKAAVADVWATDIADFAQGPGLIRGAYGNLDRADLQGYSTFRNTGQDEATARQVANDYQDLMDGPEINSPPEWNAVLDQAKADVVAMAATMSGLRSLAADLETELEGELGSIDLDPTLAITATGTAQAGATVQLGLSGLPAGSDVVWDLDGDGVADDATGDTTAWTVPGDATVGVPLVVSAIVAGVGYQGTATTVVTVVAGGNRSPVLSAAEKSMREIAPSGSTSFASGATDPDGDTLTYEWLVDGQVVAGAISGTFTFDAGADEFGGRYIEVLVSDGQALTRSGWFVRITTADADNDGWRAAPGPDCMDVPDGSGVNPAYVRPNYPEVVGNGVDDDCSDLTPDDGSGSVGYVSVYGMLSKTVGDIVEPGGGDVGWTHPQRYSGETFRLTVDWGDGSAPTVSTVAGTTYAATQFPTPRHRYGKQNYTTIAKFCVELVSTGYKMCDSKSFAILNNRPMVNAADLRTWGPGELASLDYPQPLWGGWKNLDDEGRQVMTTENPNNMVIFPSNTDLPGGYGRAALSQQLIGGGDDDVIGMLFGYQSGESDSPTGDFVGVTWTNGDDAAPYGYTSVCNDAPPSGTPRRADPFSAWRQYGFANFYEAFGAFTMNVPYDPTDDVATGEGPQKASCSDDQGRELLASVPTDSELVGKEVWKYRADRQSARPTHNPDPYLVEYDYQPDSLRVWVDGVLQIDTHPIDPAKPFPPGAPALYTLSQDSLIASVTAPEETFSFVQGKGGEFSTEAPDGITMPMHDGADDTHMIRIDWGDGTATTEGTRTVDAAKGWGWFELGGSHVYDQSGTFHGKVCATDQFDLQMCFPFTAEVDGVGPVVNAGLDRPTSGAVALSDMSFQDPGLGDSHTATIDWDTGDAEGPEAVDPADIDQGRGGGLVSGSHTYTSDGERTVELCVTDQTGLTGCDRRVLDVIADNLAPVTQITSGPTLPEGSTAEVSVGFTDANPDDVHTVTVDWGDGSAVAPVTIQDGGDFGSGSATHAYRDDGSFTVTFEACDQDDDCNAASSTVTVTNAAPTVDAQGTATDGTATLSGSYADPGADDTHTATVDWGDGTALQPVTITPVVDGGSGTLAATHNYTALDTYDVSVCVTDDDGAETCDGFELSITSVTGEAPTVIAPESSAVTEGDPVTMSATFTDPDVGDVHTASVTWGDGSPAGPAAIAAGTVTASHTYRDDDGGIPHTVTVTVCDQLLRCGTDTTTVAVANAAPVVDAGRDRTAGLTVALDDSTFVDAGIDDTHTATVDWGDGSAAEVAAVTGSAAAGGVQASHTYAATGSFTVEVCVTDDEDTEGCDSFALTVNSSPIEVTAPSTASLDEGGTATVPFTFTDADGGSHTATVRWADGSPAMAIPISDTGTSGSGSAGHTYVDDGTFGVTIEVCDGAVCGTAVTIITVTNVAPMVNTPTGTATDATLILSATFSDPGTVDAHTATIDWGDGHTTGGSVDDRSVTGSHTYTAAGSFTVKVCVTDDSDDSGCAAADLDVDDPPNTAPTVSLDAPGSLTEGSVFALTGTLVDPDADAWTLDVDWGDGTTTDGLDLTATGTFSTPHAYDDDGSYTITAVVSDGDAAGDAVLHGVGVANVAPIATVTETIDGLHVDLAITATDPGVDDELSGTVNWGDGTVDDATVDSVDRVRSVYSLSSSLSAAHDYGAAGTFDVEACVRDTDGGSACSTHAVTVASITTTTVEPVTTTSGPVSIAVDPGGPPPSVSGRQGGTVVASGELPRTGNDVRQALVMALVMIAVGSTALVLGRRRRRWGDA